MQESMRDDEKRADEKQLNPFDRDKVDKRKLGELGRKCSISELTAENAAFEPKA